MKKVLCFISLFSIICFILSCCGNQNKKTGPFDRVNDTLVTHVKADQIDVSIEALQGIWAETDNDDALFFIKGDSLYYTEDQDRAIEIKLKNDTLIILGDVSVHCKILKLTRDSLWFIDEFNEAPTKLYKR
jgi:hypothetical protein